MASQEEKIKAIVEAANKIVVIQADNPDGDSLASALALEQILEEMGKKVVLYCAVDMPGYLKYLAGWDRITSELPAQFDASIIVDTSSLTLLEKLNSTEQAGWVGAKPCIVLDHHLETGEKIPFADIIVNQPGLSSTGELIYVLSKKLGWQVDVTAGEFIMTAILSDSQGLTNDLASAETYRVLAELIDIGVNRPKLEESRREMSKMNPKIFKYKADLIKRTEFFADGQIAVVSVPQVEISEYSPLYNPAPLIHADMLQTEGVGVGIVLKSYDDGRITGAVRCNQGYGIAAQLAEKLGGGGHEYASGFKILKGKPLNEIKSECISIAEELINKIKEDTNAGNI